MEDKLFERASPSSSTMKNDPSRADKTSRCRTPSGKPRNWSLHTVPARARWLIKIITKYWQVTCELQGNLHANCMLLWILSLYEYVSLAQFTEQNFEFHSNTKTNIFRSINKIFLFWHKDVNWSPSHLQPKPRWAPDGEPYQIKHLNFFYTCFKLVCFSERELVQSLRQNAKTNN